jgi:copper oxidase (laccase) domain-containing protein
MEIKSTGELTMDSEKGLIEFFPNISGIKCFFTTKKQGDMKVPAGDGNREEFALRQLRKPDVVFADVQHGAEVRSLVSERGKSVEQILGGQWVQKCDGLFTNIPIPIGASGSDCHAVFFLDYLNRRVGVSHISSHNIRKGIIPNSIRAAESLGSDPSKLLVLVGPGICQDHYEFDMEEARTRLAGYSDFFIPSQNSDSKVFIDMVGIIRHLLIGSGISSDSIIDSGICTYKDERLFSYRRDQYGLNGPVKAGMAVIMLE